MGDKVGEKPSSIHRGCDCAHKVNGAHNKIIMQCAHLMCTDGILLRTAELCRVSYIIPSLQTEMPTYLNIIHIPTY